MPQVGYEFSGQGFNTDEVARFNASIGREFYSAETQVTAESDEIYLCNSRALAGYIPISTHRSVGASTVTRRSWAQVRNSGSDVYLLWLPLRGTVTIAQNGQTTVAGPGSLALSSANEPLCITTTPDDQHEHLSMQVLAPAHLVTRALSEPKRLCGVSFPTTQGASRIASDLFTSLYDEAEFMDRGSAEHLAISAMDAVFKWINNDECDAHRSIGIKEARLQRLLDYLELHYCDPELSTEKVAKACDISMRYLHYLLKSKGKRFYDFLWQSRLNNAYEQLVDPTLARRTIAEIAFATGFKSSAHFSRAFRNHYALSPKQVRQGIPPPVGDDPFLVGLL